MLSRTVFLNYWTAHPKTKQIDSLKDDTLCTLIIQVSKQCMEMVAESVIFPSKHLGHCSVNPTFTAIVEGKEAKEVRRE